MSHQNGQKTEQMTVPINHNKMPKNETVWQSEKFG